VINTLGAPGSTTGTDLQGINGNLSGYYALGSNIDATATSSWNSGAGFTPLGNSTTNFTGSFNGLGHTISNLTINVPSASDVGLFGYTGTGSVIQNVGLLGGSVTGDDIVGGLVGLNNGTVSNSYATGNVSGSEYVGGLVGYNAGSISNSYATGSVSGYLPASEFGGFGGLVGFNESTVTDSYATGGVSSSSLYPDIGGLVGWNEGTISNSYATGSVSGSTGSGGSYYIGGLVGLNDFNISNSYATGAVKGGYYVGGLTGFSEGTVSTSYATGSVSGTTYVGGLVGLDELGSVSNHFSTISDSYATGSVSGTTYVGGLVGINYGTISNSYATGSVSGITYVGGLVGYNGLTVSGSFWDAATSGQSSSAGGTGMTSAQMQTQANFTSATSANGNVNPGWDFTDTWVMYSGYTFPLLRSFMTPLTVTANNATTTYDQQPYSGGNGVTYSTTPNANLLGTVSYGGTTQGAINAGGYSITPAGLYSNQQGYIVSYVSGTLTVNPLALTGASIAPASSLYGGPVTPGVVSFSNVIAGDVVSASASIVSPAYSGSGHLDAGTYAQTASSTLSGANASDYTFAGFTTPTDNYTVNPLALTGTTIAAANSIYGSAVTPGLVSFGNLIAGDLVNATASIVSPAYSTSHNLNAGSYEQTATTLSGADAGNYSFAGYTTPTNNYTVNQLALAGASIVAANSTYGSTVTPGAVSFSNVITGDVVSSTASIVSPFYSTSGHLDAGSYAQTASVLSGADAGDYTFAGFTTPTNNYTVNQLALTGASIAAGNSIYGSTVTPGVVSLTGVISSDMVSSTASIASPTYSTSHNLSAGSYAQTASTLSGADAGNYSFAGYTTPTANYTVGQLALTMTGATATNRVYNGSTVDALAGTPSIAPIANDVVSLSGTGTGTFADPNVGNGKAVTVSGYTLSGADAGDYTLVEPTGLTANITQLASVAWVGAATGNWSTASNWAGDAIPDFSNVAAVTIPQARPLRMTAAWWARPY